MKNHDERIYRTQNVNFFPKLFQMGVLMLKVCVFERKFTDKNNIFQ